jgi:riboflavin kinase/FMN adenylyltransferase
MKIYHTLNEYEEAAGRGELPFRSSAVTLGKFDGVHLGHQALLRRVKEASGKGLSAVVFAIDVRQEGILSHRERACFLEQAGMDVLTECPFSREFMNLTPVEFIERILVGILHAEYIAVGTDFRFGHRRMGDAQLLCALAGQYGYRTEIVPKERYAGLEISSTRVRDALQKGDMELAKHLLGRSYPVAGRVMHGNHIGTGLGMPTINLLPEENKLLPPLGVYASHTVLEDGRMIAGVTNLGYKPTVGSSAVSAETNLFDFHEDLYGSMVRTGFEYFIRPERKFDSLQDLAAQVEKDIRTAEAYFSGRPV